MATPVGPEPLDLSNDTEFDALMNAAQTGNQYAIKVGLGARRELVNGYNNSWWTPTHKAVLGGQPEVLKLLIDANADVNAQNDKGTTPLILACYTSSETMFVQCIELLLQAGADKGIKDDFEMTAHDYAKDDDHSVALELLK